MRNLLLASFILLIASCSDKTYRMESETPLITTKGSHTVKVIPNGTRDDFTSTTAGNLMATAMREVHNLDIALYPRDLISDAALGFAQAGMNDSAIDPILDIYPKTGNKDEFMIGIMRGRDIKKLLRTRIQDNMKLDIEVAGMVYHVHMVAGVVTMENYGLDNGRDFDDSESYRVAINQHFFFSGETFPSYKFRNGLNFSFVPNGKIISASETLKTYLRQATELPYLKEVRGRFSTVRFNHVGKLTIPQIQGEAHRSPYYAHRVTTQGIVTGLDNVEWYPRGIDIVIQDPKGDGNIRTSDAIMVHLTDDLTNVKVGDLIEVTGTVYEQMTLDATQNMSKTVIRELSNNDIKILSSGNPLPEAVLVGKEGRRIPDQKISTWTGDLNFKPFLNLEDGIDFWESLESMRVRFKNLRVAGFRGGQEELVRQNPQRHLSLYVVPDGIQRVNSRSLQGGLIEDIMAGNFSPEVIHMSAGNLTHDLTRLDDSNPRITFPKYDKELLKKLEIDLSNVQDFPEIARDRDFQFAKSDCDDKYGVSYVVYESDEPKEIKCRVPNGLMNTKYHYNIGDVFKGEVEGILSFESNLFGGAEYTLVLPQVVYRYEQGITQLKKAPCIIHAYEYLNPGFAQVFEKGIQNTSCEEITAIRAEVMEAAKNDGQAADAKISSAATSFIRPSFAKDENGNPKRMINCLDVNFGSKAMPFECRPITTLKGDGRQLTVAAYNLENLAGNQNERILQLGEAIKNNLRCPDILSLVEVQDDNGLDLEGGADASKTLQKIIKAAKCNQDGVRYKFINVNPVNHNEGGQPGGNIRVAILYNSSRVGFTPWGQNTDGPLSNGTLQETRITPEGNLSVNPGRIFPNSNAFKNTRKSIVAQFDFLGEKIFIIGNHFNSKLGDTSTWGARQPFYSYSDEERALLAATINEFVRIVELKEPNAHIAVMGDFNANYNERSMRTLENGGDLVNMMFHPGLVHPNDRYSHNHNGSSSAIDFIFANRNFMKKNPAFEVLHINSDYMGRLSDHDPVVARFYFPYKNRNEEVQDRFSRSVLSQAQWLKAEMTSAKNFINLVNIENNFLSNGSLLNPTLFSPEKVEEIKKKPFCEGLLEDGATTLSVEQANEVSNLPIRFTSFEVNNRIALRVEVPALQSSVICYKEYGDTSDFNGFEANAAFQGILELVLR